MEVLAIVPARGGSKSIPGKNVKILGSHPLIGYSIAAGLQASLVTRTIVSTDDEEIAAVARAYGAEVPFNRPAALAGDLVTDYPVFEHALTTLMELEGYRPDMVVQLRPTSPFRPPDAVDQAIRLLAGRQDADSVRAVTPSGQNPYKMWHIESDMLSPVIPTDLHEPYNMPRQQLPDTFWQTGHIEVIRTSTILEKRSLTGDVILPLVMDSLYAVDLDTLDQWAFATYLINQQKLNFVTPKK